MELLRSRGVGSVVAALAGVALCLAPGLPALRAQPAVAPEYQLKAVFLFHFAQFVQWPRQAFPEPDSPLIIGVLGADPFGPLLDQIVSGQTVNHRRLVVRRFRDVEQVDGCHILFIARTSPADLRQILNALRGKSVLTVGDMAGFARQGGMIGFVTEDNRIRFRINLQAAKAAHLTLSSLLLRPAEIVAGED